MMYTQDEAIADLNGEIIRLNERIKTLEAERARLIDTLAVAHLERDNAYASACAKRMAP